MFHTPYRFCPKQRGHHEYGGIDPMAVFMYAPHSKNETCMYLRLVWGCGAVFLWRLLILLPVSLFSQSFRTESYLAGLVFATAIVLYCDRRLFIHDGQPKEVVQKPSWFLFAFLAGVGFAILGKEIGNIGLSLADGAVPIPAAQPEVVSQALVATLSSLVYPICFMVVLAEVTLRTFLAATPVWAAILMTTLIGCLGVPIPLLGRIAFVIALPIWLYVQTHSLSLAVIAYLPTGTLPLLNAIGWAPGIDGFDVESPERILFQPAWFNIVGAVLVAGGMGPMLASLGNEEESTA